MKYKYNWNMKPGVELLLNKIYRNTQANLNNIEETNSLLAYFEDYLNYMKDTDYIFNEVIYKLHNLNSLNLVSNVTIGNERLNSLKKYISFGPNLVINDNVSENDYLTRNERVRLNLYAGLSNMIINLENIDADYFSHRYEDINIYSTVKANYIVNSGWRLLGNTLSEQLAEEVTYMTIHKQRPLMRVGIEKEDYFPMENYYVISNLEAYRPFDNIVVNLSKTLRNPNGYKPKTYEDNKHCIIKKAVNGNLSRSIIRDYLSYDGDFELYAFLYLFGLFGIEKEANLGINPLPELKLNKEDTSNILKLINGILTSDKILNHSEFIKNNDIDYDEVDKSFYIKRRLKKLMTERKI